MLLDNLHITQYGEKACHPVVMLHGWGFDQRIWHLILPKLLQYDYQIYLVDLPGFGFSSMLEWDQFKQLLLNQLPKNFSVVGWSMGGLFATRLAIEHPDRVINLLNIASSPRFLQGKNWPGVKPEVLKAFHTQLCLNPEKTLQRFVQLQLRGQNLQHQNYLYPQSLSGLQFGLNVLLNWDLRYKLNDLKIPVSYIFGHFDTIAPKIIMAQMQIEYPDFNYIMFEHAAHIPFLSHQDQFIEEMLRCIDIL
jgi:pimeloyl-[acyl-carrier protein] methyl ester esterase